MNGINDYGDAIHIGTNCLKTLTLEAIMNFTLKMVTVAMALSLTLVTSLAFAQKVPVAGTIGISKEESTILAKG